MKRRINAFFEHDAAGGIVLMAAALLALLFDNSPLRWLYDAILSTPVALQIGALVLDKPLLLWINDGLMAVFFFLVGLEIKRELVEGRLSSVQQAALPAIAAIGGMVVPALLYAAINRHEPIALNGWAIPAATDIAFALGILALLGNRVPAALKVFLLALAIIDDLGAIIIIALFYSVDLSFTALGAAGISVAVLFALNRRGVTRTAPYVIVGMFMWVCVLKSGVHATLAGVLAALFVPLKAQNEQGESPLKELEHALHPWVAFMIMPVFAFANAGVALAGMRFADLLAPVPLGIALGLFAGKQIGVFGFAWLGTRLGLCRPPQGVSWAQMYGVALLAGVGFTMSLFIGTLAFADPAFAAPVRLGVLSGSLLSGILGFIVLRASLPRASASRPAVFEDEEGLPATGAR